MRDLDLGTGVLVALHGHGDEPAEARRWARRIAPRSWEVVAPGAPRDAEGVRSWFSTGARGADPAELDAAVARVHDVAVRVRAGGRPVVVVGFSQGGAVALEVAARAEQVDAVAAVCAFLPELDDESGRTFAGTSPLLVVGAEQDEHVPPFLAQDAAAVFSARGRPVELDLIDGGHEMGPTAVSAVSDWLVRSLTDGPRISLGLPVDRVTSGAELVSGPAIAELAALYERLGFHAAYVTDHPAPDDRWLAGGGHHALEPTVALAVAAAPTRRLLLHTNVYVLAYRNPFLAAKALASLDVVADGRLVIGVAAGYLRPEFAALGADFEHRVERLDEALALLPRIWGEHGVAATGADYEARAVTSLPHPVQRPHPPIWIGGNSVSAMRRAVRSAQGWSPFPTPEGAGGALRTAVIDDLGALSDRLDRLAELVEEQGRVEPLTICFTPFSLPAYLADPVGGLEPLAQEVEQLAEMGVDWISLMVPGPTRSAVAESASALADRLALG